jgi:Family of unknown function (DUF6011)
MNTNKQPSTDDLFAALDVPPWEEQPKAAAPADSEDFTGLFTDAASAMRYMLAGNSTVTLRSVKTGTRFTYKLQLKKLEEGETAGPRGLPIFVKLLVGPDNWTNYKYLGYVLTGQNVYWHGTKKSPIGKDAPGNKAFDWAWKQLARGNLPDQLEIWHEGSCGRCGRKLTVPESIASGFGPECINKIGG